MDSLPSCLSRQLDFGAQIAQFQPCELPALSPVKTVQQQHPIPAGDTHLQGWVQMDPGRATGGDIQSWGAAWSI